jgi:hypothetical protein
MLDRNGQVLPVDDVDLKKLGQLIKIMGTPDIPLIPSAENRPGRVWRSGSTGVIASRVERGVVGAARLAALLHEPERDREANLLLALRIEMIVAPDERGLFLRNAEDTIIHWGDPPREDDLSESEVREKWDILRKWAKTSVQRVLPEGDYWTFTRLDPSRWELRQVQTGPASMK